ncbi:hypothetical protein [Aquabacterium sp.]|uniref:hypothetical protein n=1 Tax=Aquabacterium sp. TaxID=1872578 RepID=UPI002489DC37|nr:hypothetical protein [Aquabacterium sp.]MDI1258960.1 hypothetical protein [Aquabacterium sp.]
MKLRRFNVMGWIGPVFFGFAALGSAHAQQALSAYKVGATLAMPSGALNNLGQVAGFTHKLGGYWPSTGGVDVWFGVTLPILTTSRSEKIQPVIWKNGKPTLLPRYWGLYDALAYQVSDNGWVVGTSRPEDQLYGLRTVFTYKDGVIRVMPDVNALVPGSFLRLVSVADGGAVLFYWTVFGRGQEVPMLWQGDTVATVASLLPVGTSKFPDGSPGPVEAYDMNDKGQILAQIISAGQKNVILNPVAP